MSPAELAAQLSDCAFTRAAVDWRGKTKELLVWSRPVLWYSIDTQHLVQLVIVRDPTRAMHDDFFFTTALGADPAWAASHYAGRWSIECVNREVKQVIGIEDLQCCKHKGPERAASLSLWLYAGLWAWYTPTYGTTPSWIPRPWYPKRTTPSFLGALATLRRSLWSERITPLSSLGPLNAKIIARLLDVLTRAA